MTLPLRSSVSQHQPADFLVGVGLGRVLAPAVGALDLQVIHVLDRLRVAQDVVAAAPDVAAEEVAELAARSRGCPGPPAPRPGCGRRRGTSP